MDVYGSCRSHFELIEVLQPVHSYIIEKWVSEVLIPTEVNMAIKMECVFHIVQKRYIYNRCGLHIWSWHSQKSIVEQLHTTLSQFFNTHNLPFTSSAHCHRICHQILCQYSAFSYYHCPVLAIKCILISTVSTINQIIIQQLFSNILHRNSM